VTARKRLVFVVDDDLAVRDSLKFLLTLEGLTVAACGSGAELLRHVDLPEGRCLVMACEMPVMGGFDVIDRLVTNGKTLPTILLTNYATRALCLRAAEAGVKFVLEKPLLNGSIIDRIREVLSQNPERTTSMGG
jgi:two-component system response regulator FixJ